MCLYCPTCTARIPCLASIKSDVAIELMDEEWYDELTLFCEENTTDHIECSVCHAR